MAQFHLYNGCLIVLGYCCFFADGIAWDWINKKLYWSDSEHREIEVLDPESGERMQLVETGQHTIPRDVAVDPNTRYCKLRGFGTNICYGMDMGSPCTISDTALDFLGILISGNL